MKRDEEIRNANSIALDFVELQSSPVGRRDRSEQKVYRRKLDRCLQSSFAVVDSVVVVAAELGLDIVKRRRVGTELQLGLVRER